jgi:hypothetical protein
VKLSKPEGALLNDSVTIPKQPKTIKSMKIKNQLIMGCWVLTFLIVSCDGNKNSKKEEKPITPEVVNNPASADPGQTSNTGMPEFKFEKEAHDFGEIISGEKVTYTFKFTNVGNAPLVINTANATCGCTVPEFTKDPVQPGGTGSVAVTFDSEGKTGMNSKTVTLIANTEPNAKVLTISADIQPKNK